ncbi:glycosyltransferase family 2 protein [Aeribacillus sp. FSL M8-0235]|uniref:glycosyltransferase family 2 protein n=1 Tax=Aeribacillus sp. FSL M8-0235 TaxID=2954576 RepID=UPI0030F973D6
MNIAICVITYKRPKSLEQLILGLDKMRFTKNSIPNIKVVVVDNDTEASSKKLCQELNKIIKWEIIYDIESKRGIPFARNKAVNIIKDYADQVVFIDDDEIPSPQWLDELLYTQKRFNADVVTGPVLPEFRENVPSWILKGGFFERFRYSTGTRLDYAATNNVIIKMDVFKSMDKHFNERYALTGGSDTEFFMRVNQSGFKIIWSDEAIVTEIVPNSRANLRWILQRAYRLGNTIARCEVDVISSKKVLIIRFLKAFIRLVQGLVFLPFSVFFGKHKIVKNLRYIWRSIGIFNGLLGIKYEEYKRHHGE